MIDEITWLAERQCVDASGHSVLMSRELTPEELVSRIAGDASPVRRTACHLGELTGRQVNDVLDELYDWIHDGLALRHGRDGDWSFAVCYGGWPGALEDPGAVSRGGAHVFHLEYEEENGKPVPPQFAYYHDGRYRCGFNLHLDHSWGYDGVDGDPELSRRIETMLAAAGLPEEDPDDLEAVHRASLDVLGQVFGLALPRQRIVEGTLDAVVLEEAD
ncbi:DUF6461 domain-containing protein [Streptomyces lancefieldiae]|uniref:DUF6461 domain-containing protein n=1 Tax=Streptomyces lancefieldiae TaxID=3075520 RepID=A0ABU3ATW2_9ACTN|nr:DUF6461 domain-containing protein [Streptomyces sp. DSM 40712]MDT0612538.1 DUF6461 domain-containing protein [Streptomyces sp. DSM 40712]